MSAIHIVKRFVFTVVLLSIVSATASAQSPPLQAESVPIKTAESHFHRGVELFNEGNAQAAMAEFRRAYELAPRFPILYNMAQVAYELNDYATAINLFERYLATGGTNIAPERRASVTEEIDRLRDRVGRVRVAVDVPHVSVAVDDVTVGVTPIAPLPVNIGRRKITICTAEGRISTQIVEVASGEVVVARFSLRSPKSAKLVLPAPRTVEPPARTSATTVAAWIATGGLAIGAGVAGALALRQSRDLDNLRDTYPIADPGRLQEQQDSVNRRALVADALLAGTALMGTVALVLTLSSSQSSSPSERRPTASAVTPVVGLGQVGLRGQF